MKKAIIAIVIALIVIIGLSGSMFTVRENEYACTVRFSEMRAAQKPVAKTSPTNKACSSVTLSGMRFSP